MSVVVAAIHIGKSSATCAFSQDQDGTHVRMKMWTSLNHLTSYTPLCALLKPDGKTLDSFGYEAEDKYAMLKKDCEHSKFFLFNKVSFHNISLKNNETVSDVTGKQLPAMVVYSSVIKLLKEEVFKHITSYISGSLTENNVHFVLTVPKDLTNLEDEQSLRQASINAGIKPEYLTIISEIDAASIYCQYPRVEEGLLMNGTSSRYMLVNAGVTITTAVHEADQKCDIKELSNYDGVNGSETVDMAFEHFLVKLFGKIVFDNFRLQFPEDYINLVRDFETKKRRFSLKEERHTRLILPVALISLSKKSLREVVEKSTYSDDVSSFADKIKISHSIFRSFFDEAIKNAISLIEEGMKKYDVESIVLFGDFAESCVLLESVKKAFAPVTVVCVPEAILKGAVMASHKVVKKL